MNEKQILHWLNVHPAASVILGIAVLGILAALAHLVTVRYLLRLVERLIHETKGKWDDSLIEAGVLRRAAMLAPVFVFYYGVQFVPHLTERTTELIIRLALAVLIGTALLTLSAGLNAINHIYSGYEIAKGRPIKGYLQIVKLFLFIMGAVLCVAILVDKSPLVFVTGIGAMTAVLLLIFRDTILSLVASIQIAGNDMVRIGDWIEMPKYEADGDVIDVALHTIKIQNWDKTITTIPTYKLIEDSFKNWRGMSESGGRRIMRSILIDMSSISFLDDEEISRFSRFELLRDYMEKKKRELEEYNKGRSGILESNARGLTNLGTFRAYLLAYLEKHPGIHHGEEMTMLVRQRDPTPEGIPLQVYAFTNDTRWAHYEAIQADIFDHILAILPQFGLRVFQKPTGSDLRRVAAPLRSGEKTASLMN